MKSKGILNSFMWDFSKKKTLVQLELPGNFLEELSQYKDIDVDISIVKHVERRSKDANSLYWLMVGRLAKASNTSAEELYKRHIRDISNYQVMLMPDEVLKDFERLWCSNHLGRFIETRKSQTKGQTIVLAYYGSSDFDKKDMSHLIDNCIQDCKSLGVETENPAEIERLLSMWGEKK